VEAEHGSMSGGDAVRMVVDEELTISTVDRVVQNVSIRKSCEMAC
jgi:hypothetical protein